MTDAEKAQMVDMLERRNDLLARLAVMDEQIHQNQKMRKPNNWKMIMATFGISDDQLEQALRCCEIGSSCYRLIPSSLGRDQW